ncbi:hypothetical protein [Actinoplanes sp. NPDC049316]|uniref:hypothetical protein n=1 Tax=Actinoplanes sp. NPDC049316 TaxID=3154727 RepID=UPI003435D886
MSIEASVLERPMQREQAAASVPITRILTDPAILRIVWLAAALALLATAVAVML